MANHTYNNEKTLTQVLQEIKNDLSAFATTRYEMLMAEVKEKVHMFKVSLPMLGAAALMGLGAFFALTYAIVAVIAESMDSKYAWFFGALIVTVVYGIVAGILGYLGYRELTAESLAPNRTMEVLKQDQRWIKDEARAA
ncbi:MAG: hypothetical protein JWO13_2715 [Acidobacteriales bacterium]|nr:hypothetical protein [Terriglobales bacterium]